MAVVEQPVEDRGGYHGVAEVQVGRCLTRIAYCQNVVELRFPPFAPASVDSGTGTVDEAWKTRRRWCSVGIGGVGSRRMAEENIAPINDGSSVVAGGAGEGPAQ
ncbi:MAG: hypothetical protein OXH68_06910 [Gammaproteobacteria bacterium]|nr:hypothetical protein [Gammaproteobacteria bacterium]